MVLGVALEHSEHLMLAVPWAFRRAPMGSVQASVAACFVVVFVVDFVVASAAAVAGVVVVVAAVAGVVAWMSKVWALLHLCRIRMRL